MSFRERLRAARLTAGFSQSELARRIGVRPSAVNHMESGRVQAVMADTLVRLAAALSVSPLWLSDGTGSPSSASMSPDESEAVQIFRALPERDRDIWLSLGRAMLASSSTSASPANPFRTKIRI